MAKKSDPDRPAKDLHKTALGLLARREHSRQELATKLLVRHFDPADVESLLDELEQGKLLDEARFTEEFIRWRIRRGHGPVKIRIELRERGVSDSLIETGLQDTGTDWVANAAEVRERRFGVSVPDDFSKRAQQARFLQGRGFTADQIRRAMRFEFDA